MQPKSQQCILNTSYSAVSMQFNTAKNCSLCTAVVASSHTGDYGVQPQTIPVHGELGHQRDVCVVISQLVLVVQEVQMRAVHCEALPTELIAGVILVQLRQGLLELHGGVTTGPQMTGQSNSIPLL